MGSDNLDTHTAAALYETLAPGEARRILRKLDWPYTFRRGSRRNMAEIGFPVVAKP
jgi:hypothetical protein